MASSPDIYGEQIKSRDFSRASDQDSRSRVSLAFRSRVTSRDSPKWTACSQANVDVSEDRLQAIVQTIDHVGSFSYAFGND